MNSREDQTEPEIDKNLAQRLPSHDQTSRTNSNGHRAAVTVESHSGTKQSDCNSVGEKIFHQLAKFFNGLHWAVGITTLPVTATAREERSFVLMWLAIIVFVIVFLAVFFYFLGTT